MLLIILIFSTTQSMALGFLGERYKGWLWFEEKPKDEEKVELKMTPETAKQSVEQFAKELEDSRFLMMAEPSPKTVKDYRDKEQLMWQNAQKLHDAWDLANLLYPEQRDLINNPVNIHAVKAKRSLATDDRVQQIKALAQEYELVLFFSSDCKYCQMLSPILKSFATKYGFKVEAVNAIDQAEHPDFKTVNAKSLVEKLNVVAFPTVIAVSRDGKNAMELIRGLVSMSELEDYSVLFAKHLQIESLNI